LSFNLYYIRAAIQQRTGRVLKFDHITRLLLEEGLISEKEIEANPLAREFDGYGRYFATEDCSVDVPLDPRRFIPELIDEDFDDES
jgi:regulator of RNase E activity RraB